MPHPRIGIDKIGFDDNLFLGKSAAYKSIPPKLGERDINVDRILPSADKAMGG